MPRLLPILALPLLLDIFATATGKILDAGIGARKSINLLRNSNQSSDAATFHNSEGIDYL